MSIALVGLSFKTAPVRLRERLTLTPRALADALARQSGAGELAVLSTCNRFEVYAADGERTHAAAVERARAFIATECAVDPASIADHLYSLADLAAVRHLFAVASGLESMVLGEAQILGQVGDALQAALAAGTAGRTLAALLRHAIVTGRRVRNETAIGHGAASISHAAVLLARARLGDLRGRHVLLVGAGKMAELAAAALADHAVGAARVLNRHANRASAIAAALGSDVLPWEDLADSLAWADVVISSTGAPHAVIHTATVVQALRQRPDRPLLFIDIAVPRDIEPDVATLPGVALADIDDLQATIGAGLRDRAAVVPAARAVVATEAHQFIRWLAALEVTPTISDLRRHAEGIRTAEVQRALRRMGDLSPRERRAVEALSVALVNKILHTPTVALKSHPDDPHFAQTARDLFGLNDAGADVAADDAPTPDGASATFDANPTTLRTTP